MTWMQQTEERLEAVNGDRRLGKGKRGSLACRRIQLEDI